jgi:hypothetical protein
MSNYTYGGDFANKDSLPSGDSGKIIRGSEFETEFLAISTAVATKADQAGPTFTGTASFADLTVTGAFTSVGIDDNATSTAITIDANEDVGIGTPPSKRMHVKDSGQVVALIESTNSRSYLQFKDAQSTLTPLIGCDDNDIIAATGAANTERLRIGSAGNVGINVSDPDERLEVAGDIKANTGGTAGVYHFGGTSDQTKITGRDSSHPTLPDTMELATGGTARLTIDDGGNVGIGTSNPSASLDVESEIHVNDPASANPLRLKQTGANAEVVNVAAGDIEIGLANDGDIYFVNGVAKNKRLTIDNLGNVGIGTNDPKEKLHIVTASNSLGAVADDSADELVLENTGDVGMTLLSSNTATQTIAFGDTENRKVGWIEYDHTTNAATFGTGNSERMTIDDTGNVGIGTDDPASTLDVTGNSPAIKINASDNDKPRIELAREASVNNWRIVNESAVFKTQFGDDSTSWNEIYRVSNSYNHYWNTDAMVLTTSGNLGIGQTSPTDLLTVGDSPYNINQTERVGVVIGSTTGSHVRAGFGIKTNSAGSSRLSIETATGTAGDVVEVITATSNGNVGIGETVPARKLHVGDAMRLEPIASAPSSPAAGDLYFDSTLNKLRCYDGTTWQNCF